MITEHAWAKINLTLRVLGRRADGYHELVSLVAFSGVGDVITLDPASQFSIETDGPFATAIDGENLIAKTCRLVKEAAPNVRLGGIRLTKNLPVAAGLGSGSADAAAVLRAILRAEPALAFTIDVPKIAASLGADVTVCLAQCPAVMRGIGERVVPLAQLPTAHLVLANPGVPLSTADVFRRLSAPALTALVPEPVSPGPFANLSALVAAMREDGNDLQMTAIQLCPPIASVLAALAAAPGCLHAAQSGSGPTCFGVFASRAGADIAAARLLAANPRWWVAAAPLL